MGIFISDGYIRSKSNGITMSNVVKCPVCDRKHVKEARRRFFRCCGVLHSVKECLLGHGVRKYEVTRKVPTSPKKDDLIEVKVI